MQKGIKEEIDFELEQYYDKYYDILRTPQNSNDRYTY